MFSSCLACAWLPFGKLGHVEMVAPGHAALQPAYSETAVLNWAWSSPEEKCLLKKQSEQSLYSQWGLAVSGRIPGCKYSSSEDLISCYVLMWLLEWFWKGRWLQQGFASRSDVFDSPPLPLPSWTCINFRCHFPVCATKKHDPNTGNIRGIRDLYRRQVTAEHLVWSSGRA